MAIHKLANGPVVMTVTQAEYADGKFGRQFRLVGDVAGVGETVVYISESAAQRQLERLALNEETLVGERILAEQVQRDGRTFTNLRRVTADHQFPPPSAPAPASGGNSFDTYRRCLQEAIAIAKEMEESGEFTFSSDNVVAMTATLFIQSSKR